MDKDKKINAEEKIRELRLFFLTIHPVCCSGLHINYLHKIGEWLSRKRPNARSSCYVE